MREKIIAWIFVICKLTIYCDAQSWAKENNFPEVTLSECRNYNKAKPFFAAPVFSTSDTDNLSFNDCGTWGGNEGEPLDKWFVFLDLEFCSALILSERTVLTFSTGGESGRCNNIYTEFVIRRDELDELMNVNIFGGECVDPEDRGTCRGQRGLLSQKVRDVKKIKVRIGAITWHFFYIWQVDKMTFGPHLQPACLANRDNQNDLLESFYSYDYRTRKLMSIDLWPEEKKCYEGKIREWKCDLYGNSICLKSIKENPILYSSLLIMKRAGRFFLRGFSIFFSQNAVTFLDVLPFMRQIVSQSKDLAMMPEIPAVENQIDFGAGQSFKDCGLPAGRRRSKREEDDDDDDKAPGAITSLVAGGANAVRGQHPWHASVSRLTETGPEYDVCGATLISKKTLVTAAHCVFNPTLIASSDLDVVLGMYNSSKSSEETRQKAKVLRVVVHPGYNHSKGDFRDDVALLILAAQVTITDFVRPICLWNSDYDLDRIVNKTGTVVGWGYTSEHKQPSILQKADLKVVSYRECFESKRKFFSVNLHPRRNFCAGYPHNQTSACKGDSGGGFSHFDRNANRHFLRGVVSAGRSKSVLLDNDLLVTCNPQYFTLYTDLASYVRWIVDNAPEINRPQK
ncbi:serine protease gd-like [Neocloeon triangulifer]|uniref:serine protease gd-like n=1 Tax=Neocloeon triangulifer TaxID=2078957 RepID=UPI00286F9C14|nr:serine protease gd-like [Neocloeon triangulifer]XP_059474417.1 serine protease gd-like [Neocloeon triangulifer]